MTTTPPEPDQPFGVGQTPYPGSPPPPPAPGAYPTGAAGGPGQAPPAPPQPPSIVLAVKLMYAGAVLAVLGLIYTVVTLGGLKDDVREQMLDSDPTVSQATIDGAVAVLIGFSIFFGLIGALLWVWMAWKNGQGRGWARIVSTVFAAFNIIAALFSLASANSEPIAVVVSLASAGLGIFILVLLYKKESTAFYEGTAASRRMY